MKIVKSEISNFICDLVNAIQKFKIKLDITYNASHLFQTLIQHKLDDPKWFVKF